LKKGKIIFIDSVHEALKIGLEADGWQCDWLVDLSREEVEARIHDYQGAVIRSKFTFDQPLIDKSTSLKFIARSGSGLENIDLEYAEKKGIAVVNSPEGNRDAVGEQCVGMILALFQNLIQANAQVKSKVWDREGNRGLELKDKTVGIIGYGQMASAFAQRLSGFGCRILAYDKYKKGFGTSLVMESTLEDIFNEAEVVSFHVPLTSDTHYYLNSGFIEKMQKPFYLINTSRGQVVNTADLVLGLKSGKIRGACLDVLEYEDSSFSNNLKQLPAQFDYLCHAQNVILSPHVAGWTEESYRKLSEVLLEKIRRQEF
jgi:D-3-phosphoglycerate dehydrogenase